MEDVNIDIEEHDLLDNPTVRRIFPNISVLKVEIKDLNEEAEKPVNISGQERCEKNPKVIQENPSLLKNPKQEFNAKLSDSIISQINKGHQSDCYKLHSKKRTQKNSIDMELDKEIGMKKVKKMDVNSFTQTSSVNSANYNIDKMNPGNNKVKLMPLELKKMLRKSSVLTEHKATHSDNQIKSIIQHSKQMEQSTTVPLSVIPTIKSKSHCIDKLTLKQYKMLDQDRGKKNSVHEQLMPWKSNKIILGIKNNDLKKQHKILVKQSNLNILKVNVVNLANFLQKSNRFCKICLTLFPSIKLLNDHNDGTHSQLYANVTSSANASNISFPNKYNLRHKCNICGAVCSSGSNLIRHKRNFHSLDIKTKTNKQGQDFQPRVNQNEDQNNFQCIHCNSSFNSHQAIIDHMYSVLQSKDVTNFTESANVDIKNVNKIPPVLEIGIRNGEKIFKDVESQSYKKRSHFNRTDIQNCVNKNEIHHIEMDEHNTKKIYLLKSAIFKCVKCHVCFLSAEKAANHIKHIDALLKWKCLKCSCMFIKEERSLHAQQHLFCDNFEVFEIGENAFSHVLYKCPNCATYFRENDFYYHYSACENQLPDAEYCKICHILIDNKIKESHDFHHKQAEGKKLCTILVESDVITCNALHGNNKKQMPDEELIEKKVDAFVEMDVVPCNKKSDIKTIDKYVEKINTRTDNCSPVEETSPMTPTFMYCGTCKSFIYVSRVRKVYDHLKAHCLRQINCVCKHCGLVLSDKTISSHRKLHQDMPGLTINDFKFHDLHSGKEISPPIPKYPNCHNCGKNFIAKTAITNHQCNEEYLICPMCKIKLSSAAFPLHLSFHNYAPKVSPRPFANNSVHPKEPFTKVTNSLDSNKIKENVLLLVYICKICKVTVDSYDRVIEHCHEHIITPEKESLTKPCVSCNLIFDITCIDNHEMLHARNQHKKFSILTYDAFYITAEDSTWFNHLFGSLPKKVINQVVGNSIYKFERKIRLKILQDGLGDWTYYKCAKCKNIIDPCALFEHCLMDICYKSKASPCSTCAISLISDEMRMKHEKIHEKHKNLTLKTYRIIGFNSVVDKTINKMLCLPRQYVLYECRKCNGVVDKKQYQYHICDFEDLSKCSHCGLLLYSNDYMAHVLKHNEFCSFRTDNIKVILLGLIHDGSKIKDRMKPSFGGVKLDFLVYQCQQCRVCLKDKQSSLTHNCTKSSAVTKCHICKLYFEDNQFTTHNKLHEYDIGQFSKENLAVVQFDYNSKSSDVDIILIDDEDNLQKNKDNLGNSQINNKNKLLISSAEITVTKYDLLIKCLCGLHFLNEESAHAHYKATKCNYPRTSKQTCSKCGLCFKPSVLYSHLLKHHGNKNIFYKYNIIQISNSTTLPSMSTP